MEFDNQHLELLIKTDARSRSNEHRLDDVEKRQDDLDKLVSSTAVMAERLGRIDGDLSEARQDIKDIKAVVPGLASAADVKELQQRPGKRWDALIAAIISALVGVAVGLLFAGRV